MAKWTNEEIDLLIKKYPNSTGDELVGMFPTKTKGAINTQARRLNLFKNRDVYNSIKKSNSHKAPIYWSHDKNEKLISDFKKGLNVYDTFSMYNKKFITKKLIENDLTEKTELQKVQEIVNYKDRSSLNLNDVFKLYKLMLEEKISGFSFYDISKDQLIFCFKYYLKRNNILHNRDDILNSVIGSLLEKAKIKQIIKITFNGYYDFICSCFPKYKLKQWEFKWLNVSDGFWENKYNCFHLLDVELEKLIQQGTIQRKVDILSIPIPILRLITHNTLITYHSYQIILKYLDFNNIDYSEYSDRIYDNQLFDSKEELIVYKKLKEHFPSIIKGTKKNKVYNALENEGYIPDFIVDKIVFIEYFGMFKPESKNEIFKDYVSKTYRKNKFYNSICENYLDIYPGDLSENLSGLNKKIEEFKISLRGGEMIWKE